MSNVNSVEVTLKKLQDDIQKLASELKKKRKTVKLLSAALKEMKNERISSGIIYDSGDQEKKGGVPDAPSFALDILNTSNRRQEWWMEQSNTREHDGKTNE